MSSIRCAWLENMISVEPDGWTRPCCGEPAENARIVQIHNGISSAFNDKKLLDLRNELWQNGFSEKTRPFCHRCSYLESKGQSSLRLGTRFLSNDRELKQIQFKLSNKCQLACAHCGPDLSSTWAKLLKIKPYVKSELIISEEFLKELGSLLPQLNVLKFTGGEPFLDPGHWKILEYLQSFDRSNCKLVYITNGISSFKPKLWDGWGSIEFMVSADGFEDTYEWFRRGSSWEKLVKNVKELEKYGSVTISYSMTPYTFHSYAKAKSFWNKEITVIPIVFPDYASIKNFPLSVIQKLDNYKEIPFVSLASGNDVKKFINWATYWDESWNTVGWAKKLFYWYEY